MNFKDRKPAVDINPNDTKIELNCRTVKPILIYFEERYGRKALKEFIDKTGLNLEYFEDNSNWISYDYWRRLLKALVEYTGDPNTPFVAGTYTAKKSSYGSLETYFSRLGTPATAYRLMAEFGARYNKIVKTEVTKLKKNSCTITLRYFDSYKQDKNNCLYVQGTFASFPTFWNLPPAKIKHIQCAAAGADSCVYELSWTNKNSYVCGLSGLLAGALLIFFFGKEWGVFIWMGVLIIGYLAGRIKDYRNSLKNSIKVNERESKDLIDSIETIEKMNIELQDKVERRTRELKDALEELRKSQHQLIQSEKMATVGRLAAGMAHELNNPVGAIRNYVQDVLEDITPQNSLWPRLKSAEKATGRCKRIVNDLLSFSRESKQTEEVDINHTIKKVITNAKEDILKPGIKIVKELEPDLPKVRADSVQLRQVFMNIIMNAADAIKDKGQITVKTGIVPGGISVEVSDTGMGIPRELRSKIFDPFVTTKAPGKGVGLGLAISYNIIKRFDGEINVTAGRNNGATFTITLPVAK